MTRRTFIFKCVMYAFFCNVQMCVHASGIIILLTGKKNILYSGWYPGFDWEHNRRDFWTIYSYQYIGIFITGCLNVGIDLYYCLLIHVLSAQINIIGHRIKSIQFDDTKSSIADVRLELIQQISTHQQLNSSLRRIQRNVQWAYFAQILLSSIVICSIIRELAEVN